MKLLRLPDELEATNRVSSLGNSKGEAFRPNNINGAAARGLRLRPCATTDSRGAEERRIQAKIVVP